MNWWVEQRVKNDTCTYLYDTVSLNLLYHCSVAIVWWTWPEEINGYLRPKRGILSHMFMDECERVQRIGRHLHSIISQDNNPPPSSTTISLTHLYWDAFLFNFIQIKKMNFNGVIEKLIALILILLSHLNFYRWNYKLNNIKCHSE